MMVNYFLRRTVLGFGNSDNIGDCGAQQRMMMMMTCGQDEDGLDGVGYPKIIEVV